MDHTFDILLGIDPRFPGGTSGAVAHELRALYGAGLRVGLVRMPTRLLRHVPADHRAITEAVDAGWASWTAGIATAPLLAVHNPQVLDEPDTLARIDARVDAVVVVAHQVPVDGRGAAYVDPVRIAEHARALTGHDPVWAPITPLCRDSIVRHGLPVRLLTETWANTIFVDDWGHARPAPPNTRLTIGRHSRTEPEKWPATMGELRRIYAADAHDVDVRFLGVDDRFRRDLGPVPRNWTLIDFGAQDVRSFLSELDVFVYLHHPRWIETFGRTVAEAIAAGVPCVLPPYFEQTFGPAALYSADHSAVDVARRLHADPEAWARHAAAARTWLDQHYGGPAHARTVIRLLDAARTGSFGRFVERAGTSSRDHRAFARAMALGRLRPVFRRADKWRRRAEGVMTRWRPGRGRG